MAGTTADGYPYCEGSDYGSTIDDTSLALANKLQGMHVQDVIANLPAFGVKGRFFYATNTGQVLLDTGTAWVSVTDQLAGLASARPASMPRNGMTYYATDTGDLSTWYGSWVVQATAWAEYGSGGSASSATLVGSPVGTLAASNGPTIFSRVTGSQYGGANTAVSVSKDGLYRVSARFTKAGSIGNPLQWHIGGGLVGTLQPLGLGSNVGGSAGGVAVVRLVSGDEVWAGVSAPTDAAAITLSHLLIERVGP